MSQPDLEPDTSMPSKPRRAALRDHWMIIGCVGIVVVAIALAATGVASAGWLAAALICVAIMGMAMVLMMRS
jgi:hypothetical protein